MTPSSSPSILDEEKLDQLVLARVPSNGYCTYFGLPSNAASDFQSKEFAAVWNFNRIFMVKNEFLPKQIDMVYAFKGYN